MIWSNLIKISNRKFEKLTFSTISDSESTKSFAYSSQNNSSFVTEHPAKDDLANLSLNIEKNKNKINPNWITGFIDAEGSFSLILSKNNTYSQGWLVFPVFQVTLHKKDRAILEAILNYFNGIGSIFSEEKRNSVKYRVASFEELGLIIEHLDKYPLITQKKADYLLFKQAWELINQKRHLTSEGLNQIVNIRAAMNLGLTDTLKREFPAYIPVVRPLIQDQKIKDPYWLAGFTSGEGCFMVKIGKSVSHKSGYRILLEFVLTQHIRDEELMKSIISYLGCGRYIFRPSRPNYAEFTVTKFSEVNQIIIPFFEKYPIIGVKLQDFRSFCKVAKIMVNKDHLTKEGLEQVLSLKQNMNKSREQEEDGSHSE